MTLTPGSDSIASATVRSPSRAICVAVTTYVVRAVRVADSRLRSLVTTWAISGTAVGVGDGDGEAAAAMSAAMRTNIANPFLGARRMMLATSARYPDSRLVAVARAFPSDRGQ